VTGVLGHGEEPGLSLIDCVAGWLAALLLLLQLAQQQKGFVRYAFEKDRSIANIWGGGIARGEVFTMALV
jgi:hypothetical protein